MTSEIEMELKNKLAVPECDGGKEKLHLVSEVIAKTTVAASLQKKMRMQRDFSVG